MRRFLKKIPRQNASITLLMVFGIFALLVVLMSGSDIIRILAETCSYTDSVDHAAQADIFDIRSYQIDGAVSGDPFFKPGRMVIGWNTRELFQSYRIELAADRGFTRKIAVLTGKGLGPCRVPPKILPESGRYFYRITVEHLDGSVTGPSEIRWFAVDERLSGDRIQAMGEHPLGKTEGSITVRDHQGRLHMVIQKLCGDSGARDVVWCSSEDDGVTWTDHGPVNQADERFSGPATLAADPTGKTLVIGYISADTHRMPRQIVLAECDLTEPDPVFKHHRTFEGRAGLSWRRPFITFDKAGIAHAGWDGPHPEGAAAVCEVEIYYTNNVGGDWQQPYSLTDIYPKEPGGGTNIACAGDETHVFWEGGQWRFTTDYGKTWTPALTEEPARVLPDAMESEGVRWRIGSSTQIPGTDEIAMVFVGEKRRGMINNVWTRYLNLDSLWVTRYHPGDGWSDPVMIHEITDPVAQSKTVAPDQAIHHVERPDITADGTGRIYVAWDESTGIGPDRSTHSRTAYISWTEDKDSVRFIDPQLMPRVGTTSGMKPLLGDARSMPGCDIAWSIGDVPPNTMRPLGRRTPWIPQGIMVTTHTRLESRSGYAGYRGMIEVPPIDFSVSEPGPMPRIQLPGFTGSSRAPTEPPTPVPPTPTPTSIPWDPYVFTPVADTYFDSSHPSSNFGGDIGIKIKLDVQARCDGLFKFDFSSIPTDETVLIAEMTLNYLSVNNSAYLYGYMVNDPWQEQQVTYLIRPTYGYRFLGFTSSGYTDMLNMEYPVQSWIQDHQSNHGFALKTRDSQNNDDRTCWSRESSNPVELKVWMASGPPPTPTPAPTQTPTQLPDFTVDLQLSKTVFQAFDPFNLRFLVTNLTDEFRNVETWVALDVYSEYWFWPAWSHNPEFVTWEMAANEHRDYMVLSFTWPETGSAADGIYFWGVIRDVTTNRYYIDRESFGWQ